MYASGIFHATGRADEFCMCAAQACILLAVGCHLAPSLRWVYEVCGVACYAKIGRTPGS